VVFATVLALSAQWYLGSRGVTGDAAVWIWVGLSALAAGVLVVGWRGARWWRRIGSVSVIPLCVLSAALAFNSWVGYFPTVHSAWNQLIAGPLPDQGDRSTVAALQRAGVPPTRGVVVPVTISATASKFEHRSELVYLPPAYFTSVPPPPLPVVVMIGAAMNTPADWLRVGNAITTIDDFAAAHGGNAPVLVFVDPSGSFTNDTECVNGPRGNAADYLTKDVIPSVIAEFGVSADRANWGVVGWSMGGTCAVDLTVMHPELFSAFVDIGGDLGPNAGNRAETISQLFGGNPEAWAAFDPTTVITRHAPYTGVAGWFAIPGGVQQHLRDSAGNPEGQDLAADSLCTLARTKGIVCAVVAAPGKHDWPFAARAFSAALPWLARQLRTPAVPPVALPEPNRPPVATTVTSPLPDAHAQASTS
jgi:S-formylglutathione hydrolase FrmB